MAKKRMPPSINYSNETVDLNNLHALTELALNTPIVLLLDRSLYRRYALLELFEEIFKCHSFPYRD